MSKYRFKTKEEFIRDGLWDDKYNCPEEWAYGGHMNKYLGKDVPDDFNVYCDKKEEFENDDWIFSKNDYVLKEQQEYFDDLSQHIGRYIRALIDNPHLGSKVKKGDIGKIISNNNANFPSHQKYSCSNALSKWILGVKYELLPEDYSPEQEVKEPNIEFIPGKWYNFTTMRGKYSLYVKVGKVTDKNLFFSNGESISNGYFGKAYCIDVELIENPRLVEDLSEIQEYLPEGHPDKVKNFKLKIGKWYKFLNGSFKFGKYEKIHNSGNRIKFSEVITSTGIYDNKSTHIDFTSNIEPLEDLSEIQKYLPNEHPDKITSNKFKKGEYIVLIGDGQSTAGARLIQSDQFIKNHCYKARESKEYLMSELDSAGDTTNGWECIPYNPNEFHKTRNWRYATQEEIDGYERRGKPYDVTELQKKQLSMKEIQEECKRRFPIGCTFIAVGSCMHRILKEDSCTYSIVGKQIWTHYGEGCLYKNGKWAKLVSSPKQKDLKEEAIKYSEKTNTTILLASDIKSKELCSTYEETLLSVKLLSNKTTHLINNVRVLSSVNLKIK